MNALPIERLRGQRPPWVMGILNLTPDSFSDGGELLAGQALDADALLRRAEAMVSGGAALLDIGAESTRPGAVGIEAAVELERIGQALDLLRRRFDVALSVDTSTAAVMTMASGQGADLINDVRALGADGALEAASATGLPVCLMHMQGRPRTMQQDPHYDDVVAEVRAFLAARLQACAEQGLAAQRVLLDPGIGFGKTLRHNLALLRGLPALAELGRPLLVGVSRKRMIGELTGRDTADRVAGSVAAAQLAVQRGAAIVRVHDVAPTVDALRVLRAIEGDTGD